MKKAQFHEATIFLCPYKTCLFENEEVGMIAEDGMVVQCMKCGRDIKLTDD